MVPSTLEKLTSTGACWLKDLHILLLMYRITISIIKNYLRLTDSASIMEWKVFTLRFRKSCLRDSERLLNGSLKNPDIRIIGFGGGSALDAAKAVAALTANDGDPLDYLEVIGQGKPLRRVPVPVIAIPTTAGTGSEVTANAVLASKEHGVKVSLRSPLMLPRIALIDPELTWSQPAAVTASTGMDALTQCIEPFVSNRANPVTDAVCREGILRGGRSLRLAFDEPNDADARRDMALTALFGGMALANAKLGAVHGFAAPVGGMFSAPHGAICAILLPPVMEANIRALRECAPEHDALARYAEIARLLTGIADAAPEDGAAWVRQLVDDLGIPALSTYGITDEAVPEIVEKAANASSMQGNPIALTYEELSAILTSAL